MSNQLWRKGLGQALLALAVAAGSFPAVSRAANDYYYSIVLERTGDQRNLIYAYRASTRQLVPYSSRLRVALDAAEAPNTVLVNSISLGLGTHDSTNWHGALLWSVTPNSKGIYPSDVFFEPADDRQSDLYISPHVQAPDTSESDAELNLKGAEENSAELPVPIHQLLATGVLGIAGGSTGQPSSGSPENLVGFDARVTPSTGRIYFTISDGFWGYDGNDNWVFFETSDVLYAANGRIFRWAAVADLGPDFEVGDRIDALDVDAVYHHTIGKQPSFVFSLSEGSPSVENGPFSASDLFHYELTTSAAVVHRNAFAAGLPPDGSDIDSVVSIDPATTLPPGYIEVDVEPFTGEVYVAGLGGVSEVHVYWDFVFEPLTDGMAQSTLEPGDEVRLDIYAVYEGKLVGHHQVVSRDEQISNPAANLQIDTVGGVTTFSVFPPQLEGEWELVIDGVPTTFSATLTQWPMTLAPGPHLVRLHYRNPGDQRSGAITQMHTVPGTVSPPAQLTATPLATASPQYRLEWLPSGSGAQTYAIEINGPDRQSTATVTGNSWDTGDLSVGQYQFDVRRVTPSTSARVRIPVSVPPEPTVSWVADQQDLAGATPGDLAYLDGSGEIIVLDSSVTGGEYLRYSINGRSVSRTSLPGGFVSDLHAVAVVPAQLTGLAVAFPLGGGGGAPGLPPGFEARLHWAATTTAGDAIVVTAEDGDYLGHYSLPSGAAASIVGMAYDPLQHRLLAVQAGALHAIALPSGPFISGSVDLQLIPVLESMVVTGVSMVEEGFYEVAGATTYSGGTSHLATVAAATDTLVSSIRVVKEDPTVDIDFVSGLVYARHGAAARPSYFVSEGSWLVEYFGRDPRGVIPQPSDENPFETWTLFGDLDGDGVPFTDPDYLLFAAIARNGLAPVLPCQASFDFNQSGGLDPEDVTVFLSGMAGGLPAQSCLPVFTSISCEQPWCGP